jgi:hypothetical protein
MINTKQAFFSSLSPEAKGALVGSVLLGGSSALGRYFDEAQDYDLPEGIDFNSLTDKQKARLKKKGGKFFDVVGAGLGGAVMGGGLGYMAGKFFGGGSARASGNRSGDNSITDKPGGGSYGTDPNPDPDDRSRMLLSPKDRVAMGVPYGTRAGEVIAMGSSNLPTVVREGNTLSRPEKILTIGEKLKDVYGNVPGGLEKAVDEAQKWQDKADRAGLVTWDRKALDRPVRWTEDAGKWSRLGEERKTNLGPGAMVRGLNIPVVNWTYINPGLTGRQKEKTLLHELTHAAMRKPGFAGFDQALKSQDNLMPSPFSPNSQKGRMWDYVTRPEEWKAHLAEVKREWVQANNEQLDTPQKAIKAMKEYIKNPENTSCAVLASPTRHTPEVTGNGWKLECQHQLHSRRRAR